MAETIGQILLIVLFGGFMASVFYEMFRVVIALTY